MVTAIFIGAASLLYADAYDLNSISRQQSEDRIALLVAATICFIHCHVLMAQRWWDSASNVSRDTKSFYTVKDLEVSDGKHNLGSLEAQEWRNFWFRNFLLTACAMAFSATFGLPLWNEWMKV